MAGSHDPGGYTSREEDSTEPDLPWHHEIPDPVDSETNEFLVESSLDRPDERVDLPLKMEDAIQS